MPDELRKLQDFVAGTPTVTVIGGMAKTGTTLPLTLLDGHPDLIVFPEELRFFHMKCDLSDGAAAAERFLANENTRRLSKGSVDYGSEDYSAHGGTGFGTLDYSMFDWDLFDRLVRSGFQEYRQPLHRFMVIIGAYLLGMKRPLPTTPVHIVSKAPHNERFARKWVRMLGKQGKFIQCTRDPIEHFLSLENIDKLSGSVSQDPHNYLHTVRKRLRNWKHYPPDQLYVLDYDKITQNPKTTIRDIAGFLGIEYDPLLLNPTKNSAPWAGNSSRKIVSETVFVNPNIARTTLPPETQRVIEVGLAGFMARMGWQISSPITHAERLRDLLARPRIAVKRFLNRHGHRFGRRA